MLACIDRGSRTLRAVEAPGRFADQRARRRRARRSRAPSRPRRRRRRSGPASRGPSAAGVPVLEDAEVWVACELRERARGRRPRDRHRRRARGRRPRRASRSLFHDGGYRPLSRRSRRSCPAARSARKKITSAETVMIPISRRTIASAIARWRSRGSVSNRVPELALGGPGARALGEEGDERAARARRRSAARRRPRGRAAAGSPPMQRPGRRPRPGRRAARTRSRPRAAGEPIAPPQAPATRLSARTAIPATRWTVSNRPQARKRARKSAC